MISPLVEEARRLGYLAVGFSRPASPPFFDKFLKWLANGKNAQMIWLKRHVKLRENPELLLKGCRTLISLAFPYPCVKSSTPEGYTLARFTRPWDRDYHDELRTRARTLVQQIARMFPDSRSRICVDSAPILERSFAWSSGIGFIGKNNMLIIPEYGSYLYLMEILTTAPFRFSSSGPLEDGCGSCKRCLEACPGGALEAPLSLDASRCLSYLTVEDRHPVDRDTGIRMGKCFYGCDVCQEVCPFNPQISSTDPTLPSVKDFFVMDQTVFEKRFGKSSLARAGLQKIKSNLKALIS